MDPILDSSSNVRSVKFEWTANTEGMVNMQSGRISGRISRWVAMPGDPAPVDKYDVMLCDSNAIDMLGGTGKDCGAVVPSNRPICMSMGDEPLTVGTMVSMSPDVNEPLTLIIGNAGPGTQGTVIVYYTLGG